MTRRKKVLPSVPEYFNYVTSNLTDLRQFLSQSIRDVTLLLRQWRRQQRLNLQNML